MSANTLAGRLFVLLRSLRTDEQLPLYACDLAGVRAPQEDGWIRKEDDGSIRALVLGKEYTFPDAATCVSQWAVIGDLREDH
jgi:hypothetical protein